MKIWLDLYEHSGESGLHLAVVNDDIDMVRKLVTSGADVNQRASGRFFLPEDQKQLRNGITDYSGTPRHDTLYRRLSNSQFILSVTRYMIRIFYVPAQSTA